MRVVEAVLVDQRVSVVRKPLIVENAADRASAVLEFGGQHFDTVSLLEVSHSFLPFLVAVDAEPQRTC